MDHEEVTIFPSYGYREDGDWIVPLRIWVHEPHRRLSDLIARLVSEITRSGDEVANLRDRVTDLVTDNKFFEKVIFSFDDDPAGEKWRLRKRDGDGIRTDPNGVAEGVLKLSAERAQELLAAQGSDSWLSFRAVSDEHRGTGRFRLLEDHGLSVISDIDDTIKITELPAGKRIVVRNTFCRDFVAAPGMQERYAEYAGAHDAAFHYVSGGPWQLYRPLANFLIDQAGFPGGSFHMKNVRPHLLTLNSWRDLAALAGGEATVDQKLSQIQEILGHFRNRKFILIGDSGEHDPDVYRKIRESFGRKLQEIIIRDVVNERAQEENRLDGMTVIEARTVVEGESQFD